METLVRMRDWVGAAKLILAAHNYIESLERDGYWEFPGKAIGFGVAGSRVYRLRGK